MILCFFSQLVAVLNPWLVMADSKLNMTEEERQELAKKLDEGIIFFSLLI